jgi:pyruvate/2-oxoglutarate dehydrogenase complex dihydrolipoamide acyltransferase (E2) component
MTAPLLSQNVALGPPLRLSPWRKVAMGTWRDCGDPSVYAFLDIDVAPAQAYLRKVRDEQGVNATLTHFFGRVIAETLARHPQINCLLRWGRLYPRKNVDVFFQVASDMKGEDLSGMTVRNADRKTVADIAKEMGSQVKRIKSNQDESYRQMKGLMGLLPGWLVRYAINASSFLMYSLNLHSKLLGVPRDSFGGAMLTNVGSLGIDMAFVPLVPYSRCPILFSLGAPKDVPVVRDGKIEVAHQVRMAVTFDHRLIDGVHASHMLRTFLKACAHPEEVFAQHAASQRLER